jgi:hypothetical protein
VGERSAISQVTDVAAGQLSQVPALLLSQLGAHLVGRTKQFYRLSPVFLCGRRGE